jgi:hypothetical protein
MKRGCFKARSAKPQCGMERRLYGRDLPHDTLPAIRLVTTSTSYKGRGARL